MRTPFFIVGSGRSGSTYLHHLIKGHPRVAITNEARILDALWVAYQAVALPYGQYSLATGIMGVISAETKPVFEEVFLSHAMTMIEQYYERTFSHPFTHFGDKLPDHRAVALAAKHYPGVRVLVIVRDPRDVVCSYRSFKKLGVASGPREDQLEAFTAYDFARVWRESYEFLLGTLPQYHQVSYTDLVARPAETMAGVLDYLGLDADPGVAEAIRTNDTRPGHATSRTSAASIARWRRDLPAEDVQTVMDVCGAMMARLGIAIDPPGAQSEVAVPPIASVNAAPTLSPAPTRHTAVKPSR